VLAPAVSVFNLNDLVLAGPTKLLRPEVAHALGRAIAGRVLPTTARDLVVRVTSLGDDIVLLGGAVLILESELGFT
jgi:hypothetical protein